VSAIPKWLRVVLLVVAVLVIVTVAWIWANSLQ
jgi:hypothetical protein